MINAAGTKIAAALILGLAVGGFNYALLRRWSRSQPTDRTAAAKGLTGRMLIRLLTNLATVFLIFLVFRDQWAILAGLAGLLIFPVVTVLQIFMEGKGGRK